MKGYSPTRFNTQSNQEVASIIKQSFIELGAITEHDEDCKCEECKSKDNE